ncbi:MAG TPA: MASE3 domain-containing protein, partial [Rhodocyclaceae bacterium]|nr:MASE3 domain-containing protein [Rhodocyclaceae bacterium]
MKHNALTRLLTPPARWALGLTLLLLVAGLLPPVQFFSAPEHYLPLHSFLEFLSMAVSAMVAALVWNLRDREGNHNRILLGAGFLAVSLIDFAHTLSYTGMPTFVTASGPEKAINFWLMGRLVTALTLLGFALLPSRHWSRPAYGGLFAAAVLLALGVMGIELEQPDWLPHTFIPGEGLTPFKVLAEYTLTALYGLAAWRLFLNSRRQHSLDLAWLAAAAWVLGLAELFFTLYASLTDLFNLLGHLYKVVAYVMIYRALYVSGIGTPYAILDQQGRRLTSILEGTDAGTWEWNIQTGEAIINQRCAENVGYRLEELQPISIETWRSLAHPDDYQLSEQALLRHFRGETPGYSCELRLRHKDGHWVWIQSRGKVASRDKQGNPVWMYGTHQDITERKQAEAKMARLVEEQEAILRSEVVGLALLRDDTMVWTNQALVRMLGYAEGEMLNTTTRPYYPDEATYQETETKVWEAFKEQRILRLQLELQRKDGSRGWYDVSGALLHPDSRDSIWALVDISEQKRNEAALISARQVADQANQAKSQFLANMSHEIRTPMNGILGMTQMLLMPGLKEEDRLKYAQVILSSGQTLMGLLNDILDLSRVEAGKLRFESVPFKPEQVLQEVALLFHDTAAEKGLQLSARWQGTPGLWVCSDPARLRQMLSNLANNAVKFTDRGHINITGTVLVSGDEDILLEFSVSDTGIGIEPDMVSQLFQPFSQADGSITRRFGGTGLGLSIVKNFARHMGGDVGLESEPGLGTRVWFRIQAHPAVGTATGHPIPAHVQALPLAGEVLIAEDKPVNRLVLESLLESQGLAYRSFANGQEVTDYVTSYVTADHPAALVLMDCQMPIMDGYEATRRIRQWQAAGPD